MQILKQLAISLVLGTIVFAIVIVAAWVSLREEPMICRQQRETRNRLRYLAEKLNQALAEHPDQNNKFPDRLGDFPQFSLGGELDYLKRDGSGDILDEWQNPIRYRADGDGLVLLSLGRDGAVGGIGPDADLYSDDRNRGARVPSFRQFVTERDSREIETRGFFLDGVVTAGIVACTVFINLFKHARGRGKARFRDTLIAIVVIVGFTIFMGVALLPAHVPNGH
jgi:hypothetical protein